VEEKFSQDAGKRDVTPSLASNQPKSAFPRNCRLVHRAEYDAVYREGRRRSNREMMLFVRPNGLTVSRFGWSIKKALGTAVRRNRIRRRLREIVRLHLQEITPGWDIVIHPRSSVATADFSELTSELLRLIPSAPAGAAQVRK
jgi:ribonuclease P protein component